MRRSNQRGTIGHGHQRLGYAAELQCNENQLGRGALVGEQEQELGDAAKLAEDGAPHLRAGQAQEHGESLLQGV